MVSFLLYSQLLAGEYSKEDPTFTRASIWLHFPVWGPTWSSRSQPCPEHTCKGSGPSEMQDCAPDLQPERAPGERQGGAMRAQRGGRFKDLDSWVVPRAGEATHLGSEHRDKKAAAQRWQEELHGGTSAAGLVKAV